MNRNSRSRSGAVAAPTMSAARKRLLRSAPPRADKTWTVSPASAWPTGDGMVGILVRGPGRNEKAREVLPGLSPKPPRGLEAALEDLEVALLGLDDVVQERVDGRDLPVLMELVVEGSELRIVLE